MFLKIKDMIEDRWAKLSGVPTGAGLYPPLEEATETLKIFQNVGLQVSVNAFPLHIYYMASSAERLAIRPAPGGKILATHDRAEINDQWFSTYFKTEEREITIYKHPL